MARKLAYGEPPDVEGACCARLYLADNFGDGAGTFVCRREPGHAGLHEEWFSREDSGGGQVRVQWEADEGKRYADCHCSCGCSWAGDIYLCCHPWDGEECSACGMTRQEHAAMVAERERQEQEDARLDAVLAGAKGETP